MTELGPHLLLHYDYVDDIVERRVPHREAHLAYLRRWRDDGRLLMAGGVGDPVCGGLLVVRGDDPAVAEELAAGDPYTDAGLIVSWRVEPWNVAV